MKHNSMRRIASALCICLLAGAIAACSKEESPVTPATPEQSYTYAGFVLDVDGQETVRVENGAETGKIFLRINQVIGPVQFVFLDSAGQRVSTPADSAIVLFSLDRTDCIQMFPLSLPNNDFGWAFSLNAMKLGVTQVHVQFAPAGLCKETDFPIQVPG